MPSIHSECHFVAAEHEFEPLNTDEDMDTEAEEKDLDGLEWDEETEEELWNLIVNTSVLLLLAVTCMAVRMRYIHGCPGAEQ